MRVIKFFVVGESGIGKSLLVDTYLWKLHFGYAYHDHQIHGRRYHIQLKEISQIDDLDEAIISSRAGAEVRIYFNCFNVSIYQTFQMACDKWLKNILDKDPGCNIYLLGLLPDLKSRKLFNWRKNVNRNDCLNLCSNYDKLHYMKCSCLRVQSVREVFDFALRSVLYN
ncbi:rho-related protein racF1-like [Stomoxys calcitrans]|uniref:rho-related protein racF1-like n=1 Tax=Stomoxys calcitrans TaxID=35570 RepID=UPI0027E2AE72|nr:rho-related protein racF1-like [Stomoxys calcitrans]